jgi:hypothetical protein
MPSAPPEAGQKRADKKAVDKKGADKLGPNKATSKVGRLDSLAAIHREVGRLYRAARRGEIETGDALRLSSILKLAIEAHRLAELEPKLAALEARMAGEGREAGGPPAAEGEEDEAGDEDEEPEPAGFSQPPAGGASFVTPEPTLPVTSALPVTPGETQRSSLSPALPVTPSETQRSRLNLAPPVTPGEPKRVREGGPSGCRTGVAGRKPRHRDGQSRPLPRHDASAPPHALPAGPS